jgi:hypothetical protein
LLKPIIENWKSMQKTVGIIPISEKNLESDDPLDCFVANELQTAFQIIAKVNLSF